MSVTDFYKGKHILITGGLGYVGKVVTEKLLRTCDVGCIYFIIRTNRRNESAESRLNEFKKGKIFERLRKEKPEELDKIKALQGDLLSSDLGLSDEDRALLIKNVSIVIHSAAKIDIDVKMKDALEHNVLGTKKLLELAKQMDNISGFIYVSTAYVNYDNKSGSEKLVKLPLSVDELLLINSQLNDKERDEISPSLLQKHTGWYFASKAYAEKLVAEEKSFSTAIIRPCSIGCSWKDPEPGYNESMNSLPGFILGALLGVVRVSIDNTPIIIPVDIVSNTIICSGWNISTFKPAETQIVQTTHEIQYKDYEGIFPKVSNFASAKCVWYPSIKPIKMGGRFFLNFILLNVLPGILLDFLLLISTGKTRVVKKQIKILRVVLKIRQYLEPFKPSQNIMDLENKLSEKDREIFPLDVTDMDSKQYLIDTILGVRKYLLKEEEKLKPSVRRRVQLLFCVNLVFELFVCYVISKLIALIFGITSPHITSLPIVLYIILYVIC